MECGSGFEGRRRGCSPHVKCAERQTEGLAEDTQTPRSHSVGSGWRHRSAPLLPIGIRSTGPEYSRNSGITSAPQWSRTLRVPPAVPTPFCVHVLDAASCSHGSSVPGCRSGNLDPVMSKNSNGRKPRPQMKPGRSRFLLEKRLVAEIGHHPLKTPTSDQRHPGHTGSANVEGTRLQLSSAWVATFAGHERRRSVPAAHVERGRGRCTASRG